LRSRCARSGWISLNGIATRIGLRVGGRGAGRGVSEMQNKEKLGEEINLNGEEKIVYQIQHKKNMRSNFETPIRPLK
jgi:hypothetical protein